MNTNNIRTNTRTNGRKHKGGDTIRTYEQRTEMRELRRQLRELMDKEAHECKPCEVCKAREERKSRTRGILKAVGKWAVNTCFRLGYPLALVYAVIEGHIPLLT